jgi:hypothetical protein
MFDLNMATSSRKELFTHVYSVHIVSLILRYRVELKRVLIMGEVFDRCLETRR